MDKKNIIVKETDDGSKTFFVPSLDEHYHSVKGAYTESKHIYIDYGFNSFNLKKLSVLEIGFGTGLNTYLTAIEAEKREIKTDYTTLEKYPLSWSEINQLNEKPNDLYQTIHTSSWNHTIKLSPKFSLLKIQADYTKEIFNLPEANFDLVYFDAFAPEKQPNMWQEELFQRLYVIMKPNSRLTTYCVKGAIRRMMQRCGFEVKRLPGPPGGKRQILCAIKNE
ncbi:MAG: tRNA (5-methylaminomethyl-2-thiouridine)(34)-methyltransferase MnmD [Bacteroides sp.]|mgnify:CR=1 FL=1|nr:tRNA (5-methylaminomethyl-2-thiouridine)(34)-methyltransferase MnmD [Bacteroides sp.]MDD2645210.1 tRNA (5-methylaminomethyl-2-thiouridine)(34)-methyltransferase MnmD [Bacteroides sp.]MDD4054512.1 tRNA (5-methylaminomethyl-2-thiouridine)(34)-methyltransferase MnmD [Bacteroides sp.]MDD4719773.1 tRNA (5-methylaminomethyl-2-thiouridine)(34)-methyltransferase MnmD [Bacteroides sp.]NLI63413.1 tRNA (5-methylaminomethyl-2-thiouridine)(34)-methyltransferase MnmD [Bacteroidales bacterium]